MRAPRLCTCHVGPTRLVRRPAPLLLLPWPIRFVRPPLWIHCALLLLSIRCVLLSVLTWCNRRPAPPTARSAWMSAGPRRRSRFAVSRVHPCVFQLCMSHVVSVFSVAACVRVRACRRDAAGSPRACQRKAARLRVVGSEEDAHPAEVHHQPQHRRHRGARLLLVLLPVEPALPQNFLDPEKKDKGGGRPGPPWATVSFVVSLVVHTLVAPAMRRQANCGGRHGAPGAARDGRRGRGA